MYDNAFKWNKTGKLVRSSEDMVVKVYLLRWGWGWTLYGKGGETIFFASRQPVTSKQSFGLFGRHKHIHHVPFWRKKGPETARPRIYLGQ